MDATKLLIGSASLSQQGHFVVASDDIQSSLWELASIFEARDLHEGSHKVVKLWLDTECSSLEVPPVYKFAYGPLDSNYGCTCPDGRDWFLMKQRLRQEPTPVPAWASGRNYTCDPNCRWCIHLAKYHPKRYNWLWRHVNTASITVLAHAPPNIRVDFARSRRAIDHTLQTLHVNVPSFSEQIVKNIMNGDPVSQQDAQVALGDIRRAHIGIKMELMDYYIWRAEPNPFTKMEDQGLHAITTAMECAAFMPDKLTKRDCYRLPIVPSWDRTRQKWVLTGHWLVAKDHIQEWLHWMEPLSIETKSQ